MNPGLSAITANYVGNVVSNSPSQLTVYRPSSLGPLMNRRSHVGGVLRGKMWKKKKKKRSSYLLMLKLCDGQQSGAGPKTL